MLHLDLCREETPWNPSVKGFLPLQVWKNQLMANKYRKTLTALNLGTIFCLSWKNNNTEIGT